VGTGFLERLGGAKTCLESVESFVLVDGHRASSRKSMVSFQQKRSLVSPRPGPPGPLTVGPITRLMVPQALQHFSIPLP
jgi:hypothetical protein